mgnify:CR=1 FL=1
MADKPNPDPERPSKLANLIPVIKPGKPADDPDAGATVTMPVMAAEQPELPTKVQDIANGSDDIYGEGVPIEIRPYMRTWEWMPPMPRRMRS